MANPFYVYSGAFLPGILARAEAESTEFTAVQQGFNLLAIQGTDSGVANAYVVATAGGQNGVYLDGMIVEFKAKNANTAASTLQVDSGSIVGLTQPNGQSLSAGALVANTWYRCMYNATYVAWVVVAPTPATTITTNIIATTPPTHLVGLASAGGVSTACAPIDATYALDQSIAPTWTGVHVFGNTVEFLANISFSAGLEVNGVTNSPALTASAAATSGQSFGLLVNGGSTAGDYAMLVQNAAGNTNFLKVQGEGSVIVGTPSAGGGKGVGTINAQGLYVNGTSVLTLGVGSANPSATVGLSAVNGTATTFMTSDSAPPLSQAIAPTWTGAHVFTPASSVVAVTINAAVNRNGLIVNGGTNTSNSYLVEFLTGQASGFSSGLLIEAGTTAADNALLVLNASGNATYLQIKGDGSGSMGPSATVGMIWNNIGEYTWNASAGGAPFAFQLNGTNVMLCGGTANPTMQIYGVTAGALVDASPDKGTVTLTTTGLTSTAITGCKWVKMGNIAMITLPITGGLSTNSAAASAIGFTGLPSEITPATTQAVNGALVNVAAAISSYYVRVQTTGTIALANPSGGGNLTLGTATSVTFEQPVTIAWTLT